MKATDFEYIQSGAWVSFFPCNDFAHEQLSKFMIENEGSNKVLFLHAREFIKKLRALGYCVRKHKQSPKMSDNELLEALGV